MSDSAFKTGAYPGYTLDQLRGWIKEDDEDNSLGSEVRNRVLEEIDRRERVAAGDRSAMTAGERLHNPQ